MTNRRFLFLLGSSRHGGNTELLARRAAEQLPADVEQEWISLVDHPLPDFPDLRHDGGYSAPDDPHARRLLDATLAATDLVIASPLYWYSVSGLTKRYLDHWSGWLRLPEADFRGTMAGRTLWGVAAYASHASLAEPLAGTLHHTAAFMKMRFGGVLLGNGTDRGDVLKDGEALTRAKTFFAEEAPPAVFPHQAG
ncbi:NAD(P)H-dependent oxidoreductase [Streptomyces roseirectus]|uniref:NAD(P)H-dependent oxidoreductase n=1 Tax=Streptomyces roseirectus TaxID=2768066 RepID=A0A7H0IDK2_9ACTN|nr:NAD(P)H-dependent oxidoreductase [Streptomyces roseirectus]QNP70868.1 NAD(P)H-dependent oxidoreductase [Streptomyces roseirectus]